MSDFNNRRNARGGQRYQSKSSVDTRKRSKGGCFKCGKEGHFARDCKSNLEKGEVKDKFQRTDEPVSLEFHDYVGQKLHDLPNEVLSEPQSKRNSEKDVGILTYLNKNNDEVPTFGFNCILKHRYSDFNVNEIDQEWKVVRLTDLNLPDVDAKPSIQDKLAKIKYPAYDDLSNDIKKWVTPISFAKLLILGRKYSTSENIEKVHVSNDIIRLDVTGSEKDERRTIHTWMKEQFPHLNSDGAKQPGSDPDKKFITLSYVRSDKFQTCDSDKWLKQWPRDRKEKFLHFTLYKENCDQAEILYHLTRILSRKSNYSQGQSFGTKFALKAAGTKDKRARTSQRVSIKHVMAATLTNAVKDVNAMKRKFSQKNQDIVAVGNFKYKNNDIDMGDLKGNRFTIVLRNLSKNSTPQLSSESGNRNDGCEIRMTHQVGEADVDMAMNSLKHNGFINYFGLQRFGNLFFPKTSDVGLAMVKQDWMRAIELILYPRNNEKPAMARARAHWWMYRNANDALNLLEYNKLSSLEGILLRSLTCHHENDMIGALLKIPKHSLLLYMHAYQSLVWNKVVTKRIEMFGEKVVVGDLVQMPEGTRGNLTLEKDCMDQHPDQQQNVNLECVSDNTNVNEDISEDNKLSETNTAASLNRLETKQQQLSYVTDDTLDNFVIQDVVMVLPGHGVAYPKNQELKQLYIDVMKEDGLENGFEDLRNAKDKRFSLTGDYRKMVERPQDLNYRKIRYSDPNQNLTLSDCEIINGKEEYKNEVDGKYEALIIEMSLCSSTYATMAIREVTRMDTGKTYQTFLTDQHQEEIDCEKVGAGIKRDINEEDDPERVTPCKLAKIDEETIST